MSVEFNPLSAVDPVANPPVPLESAMTAELNFSTSASGEQESDTVQIDKFLRMAVAQGASDIHLRVGVSPILRKDGLMVMTKLPPMTERSMLAFIRGIVPSTLLAKLKNRTDYDFAFEIQGLCRFRANLFYEMHHLGLVMRVIPLSIPHLEDLGLPNVIEQFTEMHKGLVLVTGPTGSGKSTTLASLLNLINRTSNKHIITLEDPVEFIHENQLSVITQRQLGVDTDTFPNGIKYALRQDPDVILIGEMRDRDTIMSAIHAAETGHMVFSTLHTIDAVQTINRIINAFEPHERDPVRLQLANVLQGTVSQRLIRKADGEGRMAVAEIMTVTPAARDYIMRNEIDEIYSLLSEGQHEGMITLNSALYLAFRNRMVSMDDVLALSDNPTELQQMIRGGYHGSGM